MPNLGSGRLLLALAALTVVGGVATAQNGSGATTTPAKKKSAPPARSASVSSGRKKSAKDDLMARRAVLIFPVDTKGGTSDILMDVITDVEQGRLMASGDYRTILFLRSLPTIQRAVMEQTLNSDDVRPPYDNNTKAAKLGQAVGYNLLMLSSIENYEYDADKKQVNLLLSGRLLDISGEKPRVLRTVVVPGTNTGGAPKDAKEETIALQVARSAAEKLMTDLLKPASAQPSDAGKTATDDKTDNK